MSSRHGRAFVAFLMVSSLPNLRLGIATACAAHIRMGALIGIALVGGGVDLRAPGRRSASGVVVYVLMMPFSVRSYARIKRQRAAAAPPAGSPMPAARS